MFILACAWHKKLHSGFQITNYLCVAPSEEGRVPPSTSASTILISTSFHYLQFTCWYICLPPFSVSLPCAFCSYCVYSQDFSLLSLLINSLLCQLDLTSPLTIHTHASAMAGICLLAPVCICHAGSRTNTFPECFSPLFALHSACYFHKFVLVFCVQAMLAPRLLDQLAWNALLLNYVNNFNVWQTVQY